jgi:hypothetical protein
MESSLHRIDQSSTLSQLIPLVLTVVILGILQTILHASLALFNHIPGTIPILLIIRPQDVLVGATIYLKTEIDFVILIGRLMDLYPGWRNRVALEVGSAVGNASGTILIIGLWILLKHVDLLLALMVIIASLVLFELAHSGMEYLTNWESAQGIKKWLYTVLNAFLDITGIIINPLLFHIIPDLSVSLRGKEGLSWGKLAGFATNIPFILGLDDFAGYIPLFNVVNVYGFAAGVIGAHTILNICLFLSPKRTIAAVKNEYVSFIGTLAFIGLGIYGLVEAGKIIAGLL